MFRVLTRGCKEKIQSKNVKTAVYPQQGFQDCLIPEPSKLTLTSQGQLISIRKIDFQTPELLNFPISILFNTYSRIQPPYINLCTVNTGGLGIFDYGRRPGLSIFNAANLRYLSGNKRKISLIHRFPIISYHCEFSPTEEFPFGSFGSLPLNIGYMASLYCSVRINGLPIGVGYFDNRIFTSQQYLENVLLLNNLLRNQNSQGTVSQGSTVARNNTSYQYTAVNRNRLFVEMINPKPAIEGSSGFNSGLDYSGQGYVFKGSINYSHTNRNQNNNASWLLRQKTQYARRFDRLGLVRRFASSGLS